MLSPFATCLPEIVTVGIFSLSLLSPSVSMTRVTLDIGRSPTALIASTDSATDAFLAIMA